MVWSIEAISVRVGGAWLPRIWLCWGGSFELLADEAMNVTRRVRDRGVDLSKVDGDPTISRASDRGADRTKEVGVNARVAANSSMHSIVDDRIMRLMYQKEKEAKRAAFPERRFVDLKRQH